MPRAWGVVCVDRQGQPAMDVFKTGGGLEQGAAVRCARRVACLPSACVHGVLLPHERSDTAPAAVYNAVCVGGHQAFVWGLRGNAEARVYRTGLLRAASMCSACL